MALNIVTTNLPFTHLLLYNSSLSLSLFSHSPYSYVSTSILYLLFNFFWQELSSLSLFLFFFNSILSGIAHLFEHNN
jgi:hypothetical protein